MGGGAWLLQRDFVIRYAIDKLGEVVRDETGLPFEAQRLDIHLLSGTISAEGLSLGGDLLKVRRIEAQADFLSLLGGHPYFYHVKILDPEIRIDPKRLAALKLKEHSPRTTPWPQVRLDQFQIEGGSIEIQEPAWGLPRASALFHAKGKGQGPNRVTVEFSAADLSMQAPGGVAKGRADFTADVSETLLRLLKVDAELGGQKLRGSGTYEIKTQHLSSKAQAWLDLAPGLKLVAPASKIPSSGLMRMDVGLEGTPLKPLWDLHLQSKNMNPGLMKFHVGAMDLKAVGTLNDAKLRALTWDSEDGNLAFEGEWRKGSRTRIGFDAKKVDLNPLAGFSRVGQGKDLQAFMKGEAEIPGDPWDKHLRLDRLKAQASGQFQRLGINVGDLSAQLQGGQLTVSSLNLKLEDLTINGKASGHLGLNGFESFQANAVVDTDAARVADALKSWQVVTLDMGGRVQTSASVSFQKSTGLQLDGTLGMLNPRWHGATADALHAQVQIQGSDLRIQDIVISREATGSSHELAGRGYGDIWLTWAKVPLGQNQFDACFRAFRLPISEGLKAADIGDLPIDGTASGWTRLAGPFDALMMDGSVMAENGVVYGLTIPAFSSDLHMDLAGHRLVLPEFRIAESPAALDMSENAPTGFLALKGNLDMDLERSLWWGTFGGNVDTGLLSIPGPRIQAALEGTLRGPWTSGLGPIQLPNGDIKLTHGRIFTADQSLENVEATAHIDRGSVDGWVGQTGAAHRILDMTAWDDEGQLKVGAHLLLDPSSADTTALASRLTQDLMEDLRLETQLSGTWDKAGFHWQGRVDQLLARFPAFDLLEGKAAFLHGNLEGAQVDLQLEAQDRNQSKSTPPVSSGYLNFNGLVPFKTTGPLSLQASGSADLGNLKTILDSLMEVDQYSLLADLQPQGTTKVDMQLQGTPANPLLEGSLKLEGGQIRVRTYPQSAENINVTVHFHDRDVSISESDPLKGQLAQGAFQSWGTLTWQMGGLSSYDFRARLDDFQLRDVPAGFEVGGSLNARLSGNDEDGGLLRGSIIADRMLYRADINLRDIILNSSSGTPALSSFDPDDPLARIQLDLDLKLDQPWRFETNLLKLEGTPDGPFRVVGTLAHPGIKGKMQLIPGGSVTNLLPAGDVTIEHGSIDFSDPLRLNPFINVQGRIDVPPYLVNLNITGRLDQLNLVPTSTPSLRQDEIVAILVDPAAAPTIGSSGGANSQSALNYGIASAGTGLIGTLALANFQEQLRKTFNLDRLSVSPRTGATGTPEFTITGGQSFNILGHRTPLLYTYHRAGNLITNSGKVEWRFGNYVLQFGVSQISPGDVNLTGEIRHTWSPN